MASVSTGSQTRSGASSSSMRSATQRWCRSDRSKKATSGPVSTIAGIAAEASKMLGIGSEVGDSGVDDPACALHQPTEARLPAGLARSFEHEPQPLLDQVLELAAAQRRLGFGPTVKIIRYFDRGFHRARSCRINPYRNIYAGGARIQAHRGTVGPFDTPWQYPSRARP